MDFTLTEEQELVRDTARRVLASECPPSLVRAHVEDRSVAGELWRHLSSWTELAGGPLTDLCLFLEETGAANAPGPFFASAALFSPLAVAAGAVVHPGTAGTVALAGASGLWVSNAEPVKTFVLDADLAEEVVFVVSRSGGVGLGVVASAGLSRREVATLDRSRRVFEVAVPDDLDVVEVEPDVLESWLERAWVSLAAEMLGTSRWLFDEALAYARAREQFGRPIGSFQAIQHKLANLALARERAWAAVYYAAMAIDADDPQRRAAAHVAKATAGQAAHQCAKEAIQIHGGIGYTWEHDLHLWMRRAFASEHLLGTTDWHYDRLADLVVVPG